MAKKIGLTVYGLSVTGEQDKRLLLNDILDGFSLIDLLEKYITANMKSYSKDTSKETLFQFEKVEKCEIENRQGQVQYRLLHGRAKTGEFGIESELVNIYTREITEKSVDQADMLPFGFCIAISAGKVDRAVILFQTIGAHGMKAILEKHLQVFIHGISESYSISIRPIAPKEYIDRYFKKGVLKKIRMIRYEIPEDISNRIGINYGVKQTKEERIIHKPLGFIERNKKKFEEWQSGQRSYTSIVELDGFEYDDFKMEFDLDGVNKTFDLGEMNSIVMKKDITKRVQQIGGNPEFKSLKRIMKEEAEECLVGMGLLVLQERKD